MMKNLLFTLVLSLTLISCAKEKSIHVYTLTQKDNVELYDEAVAVSTLQGLINREAPVVYLRSDTRTHPDYWLSKFQEQGNWLAGLQQKPVADLDALFQLAKGKVKGVVIWDTNVPATLNVATTIAGVEDGVVLSPEFAERYVDKWGLPVIKDLRGMFDGSVSGSAKNDAYRWAIDNYLSKGLCYNHRLFISEDSYSAREKGDLGYVVSRDWAVQKGSFVYDLSPWGDEKPQDDTTQVLGTDLATYKMILQATLDQTKGQLMTEIAGFFAFSKYSNMPDHKSAHDPVPTEWESVYVMSPYNCYQNTVASYCYNQSFHSYAPVGDLKQHRPTMAKKLENKVYICILMADYDSATPLYEFLWKFWEDPKRGEIPFIWGVNPSLIETYPDIIQYLYATATENDYFGADASAAGYMNPNRILPEYMPLFVEHNSKFYKQLDMTISPMVLDWDEPTPLVKDAFAQFSPDGFATIICDFHDNTGKHPQPHVWKGMPVMEMHNQTGSLPAPEECARLMSEQIPASDKGKPAFHAYRIVWTTPSDVVKSVDLLKALRPELDIEVVDPYNFNNLFKKYYQ